MAIQILKKIKTSFTFFLVAKCKKDLLLIVDTSYSVGERSFNENVKPFLQRLVTDPVLNVGREGTQLALIIFSHSERTKLLLNFGDFYAASQLSKFIHNLKWNEVSGDRTRTDMALQIANEKVGRTWFWDLLHFFLDVYKLKLK